MNIGELIEKLKSINGLVAICEFGSYGSEYWLEGKSDIDLITVVGSEISYMDTLDIEELLLPIISEYYNYSNIHLTFILFNDFYNKFARIAIDSKNIIIVRDDWFDFQHYVLKYIRNNSWLERTLKIDEQYTYFGGIIDDSVL